MDDSFHDTMRQATALTRQGSLREATRLIQQSLTGSSAPAAAPSTSPRIAAPAATQPRPSAAKASWTRPKAEPAKGWRRSRPNLRVKPLVTPQPPVAPGAQYTWHTHAGGSGTRRYRLYTPAALAADAGGAPLVVMLHGCTQNPDDFALGTRMNVLAETFGLLVAYPEQTRAANAMACWNWFEPQHQRRGGGEPESIAGIACEIVSAQGLDDTRVFVAGLSAGGAMAAVLGETHSDVFAAIGVHSGLPHGCATNVATAQSVMAQGNVARGSVARGNVARAARTGTSRTIVIHGDADRTVHPANGAAVFDRAAGSTTRDMRQDGAAQITRIVASDGTVAAEHWEIAGLGHAWSGGDAGGSHTNAATPDASEAMLRFFLKR